MKFFFSFFLSLLTFASFAQLPDPINRGKRDQPIVDARLYTTLNFAIPKVGTDSTTWLNGGKDSLGLLVQIRTTGDIYKRDTSAGTHKWSPVGGAATPVVDAKADDVTRGIATFNSGQFTDNGSGRISLIPDTIAALSPLVVSPTGDTISLDTTIVHSKNYNDARYLQSISGISVGGELSGTLPNPSLVNSAVIAKVLTGYTSGAGTVSATDNILQAIQKLNGNIATKQNTITTGTTLQYFRGDLSLATFPTDNTSFTNGAGYATATSSTAFTNKTGNISQWTNNSGYITGISSSDVTTALGFTPVTNARAISTTSPITGGGDLTANRTIAINDAAADGTTKGASTYTAADFNTTTGLVSIDYTNAQASSASAKGFLTSTDWSTFNGKQAALGFTPPPNTRNINTTSPITGGGDLSADRTIAINNAVSDGSTKGAASFTAADFNDASGNISIDYTNGQSADASNKGFLPSADWVKFNAQKTDWEFIRDAFSSAIKWECVDMALPKVTTSNILVSGTLVFQAVYVRTAGTITGVKWYQAVQGSYTAASPGNQLGLYSLSGTTLTLVASCADDGNLWKAASNAMTNKAFTTPYSAAVGIYFISVLYKQSAQTTAPQLGCAANLQGANISIADFTTFKIYGSIGGANTSLPSSQVLSGVSATNIKYWLALY